MPEGISCFPIPEITQSTLISHRINFSNFFLLLCWYETQNLIFASTQVLSRH